MKDASKAHLVATRNYGLFHYSEENRPLCPQKHKELRASMEKYGFDPAHPIKCRRGTNGQLLISDGQHRWHFAKELGLPVYYIVSEGGPTTAEDNNCMKKWTMRDYVGCFSEQGLADYATLMEFSESYVIPLNDSVTLLSGLASYRNSIGRFKTGGFKITNLAQAETAAKVMADIRSLNASVCKTLLIQAVSAAVAVPSFDAARMMKGIRRRPERLIKYGSREGFLTMLDEAYNCGFHLKVALKFEAEKIIRSRNPALSANQENQENAHA
ncbi:MAG: ParB N-terminal domain-containing protein [Candidatus Atribacteria bacterium]|nr:ParB N-terminal domain-containing protein [Candidatus Atribacteria bacterium]